LPMSQPEPPVGRDPGTGDPSTSMQGTLTDSCALQVNQGNMPGIQSTFLAMDTEEGVEVVWNELLFTDKKAFKAHEEKIKTMFEQLVLVDHPNIVKLHKYWGMWGSDARLGGTAVGSRGPPLTLLP
uniref:Uncharacterized protein n=1 Tax=Pavo cristatus TaxID=9049 RepID=A0A8C9FVJ7_PAVCR